MRWEKIELLGPVLLIIPVLALGAAGFQTATTAKHNAIQFRQDTLRRIQYSALLNSYQAESYARLLRMLDTDDHAKQESYHAEGRQYRDKINGVLKQYDATIQSSDVETRRVFDDFVAKRERFREVGRQVAALVASNELDSARVLADTKLVPLYSAYTDAGDVLFQHEIDVGTRSSTKLERVCFWAQILTGAFCLGVLLLGVEIVIEMRKQEPAPPRWDEISAER